MFFFDRQYSNQFVYEKNVEPVVLFPPARHPFLWFLWFELAIPLALKKYKIDVFLSLDSFFSFSKNLKKLRFIKNLITGLNNVTDISEINVHFLNNDGRNEVVDQNKNYSSTILLVNIILYFPAQAGK